MSGYRSRYVSPPRTRKGDDDYYHRADMQRQDNNNTNTIHRTKSFQPVDTMSDRFNKFDSLEEAWKAMRAATMRVQSGDEHGKADLKAATKAVKKMMLKEQESGTKEVPKPPPQPQASPSIQNIQRRIAESPPKQYYSSSNGTSQYYNSTPTVTTSSKSKRHSSPPRRRLRETNKNDSSDLAAFDLSTDTRDHPILVDDKSTKSSKKKKPTNEVKTNRKPPNGRLEFLSEPSDRIQDVNKPDLCQRKGRVTPGDKVRCPPSHTPPKSNMVDEALKDVNMNTFTPAPKPFVMDLSVGVSEAVRENNNAKRLPAAIPLNKMEPVPIAVKPFAAADPINAPGGDDQNHYFGNSRSKSPMAGVSNTHPPILECYLVELSPNGAPQYHQRFLHFHGSSQIVFSKSASDGSDPSDFVPREEIAVTSLLSFAPATKDGSSSHQGMEWFVITTTFTEYQAIAVDPKLLREWISWLSSRHPLIQTGATTVVLH
eukprot:TRINITY_DN16052_c0_g1_i1.p1 TRINITY_DN16052_c0_g1~~TRINITY_DN16052_c0_g1_i1.p1  ORF type:complete len:484 (+),score=111.82 TRINITY_DN16052_c0_g1_i1:68-1519(+)